MRMLMAIALVAGLVLPSSGFAAPWKVRPAESAIKITALQQGAKFQGTFDKFQADVNFDPADLAHSSVTATIDTSSFNSKSSDRDKQVQSSDWFFVSKFPAAKFVATSFKDLGGGKYEAAGTLTIRDVSKPVVLPFTLKIDGNVAEMNGTLSLLRTDYGVGGGEWAKSDWVGKEVQIDVKLVADRAT